jgi:lipopolysaccharide export LptBFGC system permease protein LptF
MPTTILLIVLAVIALLFGFVPNMGNRYRVLLFIVAALAVLFWALGYIHEPVVVRDRPVVIG